MMFSSFGILLLQVVLRTVASPTIHNDGLIALPFTRGFNTSASLLEERAIGSIALENVDRAEWVVPVTFGTSNTICQSDIHVRYKLCR